MSPGAISLAGRPKIQVLSCSCTQIRFVMYTDPIILFLFQVEGSCVYSCSIDGVIKVFDLRDTKLYPVFVSENVKLEGSPRATVIWRQIKCLAVSDQNIYYGDEGMNLKVLNWKTGYLALFYSISINRNYKNIFLKIIPIFLLKI